MPGRQVAAETVEIVPPSEDQRDVEDVAAALSRERWPGDAGYETASLAPFAGDAAEPVHTAAPDREPEREAPPAPTAESEEGVPFVSETERVSRKRPPRRRTRQMARPASRPHPPNRQARTRMC